MWCNYCDVHDEILDPPDPPALYSREREQEMKRQHTTSIQVKEETLQ
jgi:hypothetical protein